MSTSSPARADANDGYLLCGIGACRILVAARAIVRITEDSASAVDLLLEVQAPPEPLDLAALPGIAQGTHEGLEGPSLDIRFGTSTRRVHVDWVGRIEQIPAAEFIELPALFDLATQYFDAACIRPFEGVRALRLARLPPANPQDQAAVAPL